MIELNMGRNAYRELDPNWLLLINKKYSQFGVIEDFDPYGDTSKSKLSWATARKIVLDRDNYSCRICGKASFSEKYDDAGRLKLDIEVHHIIPRKIGGSNSPRNLITLCHSCHVITFKNEYSGIPDLNLRDPTTFFTDIKEIYKLVADKEKTTFDTFYLRGKIIKLDIGLEGYLCRTENFGEIEDKILDYDPDIILLKNHQNNKFIRGYLTP